jgi:hypothetical protein
MDKEQDLKLLEGDITPEGNLYNQQAYLEWTKNWPNHAALDGQFSPEYLEAIAWYIKNHKIL